MTCYLVVGAGLTGSTFARIKAEEGFQVKVIDRRNHIAGNAYDYEIGKSVENPVFHHMYGPHIFHTNSERIFSFLSRFTSWSPYEHQVIAEVNGVAVPLPFNFKSIDLLFPVGPATLFKDLLTEEFGQGSRVVLKSLKTSAHQRTRILHDFIYENVFKNYTEKMWGLSLEELGPTVADRVPVQTGYDNRYFADKYQALPSKGYSAMVSNILDHTNIEVCKNLSFVDLKPLENQKTFYTGAIDEYYNYSLGHLPYRSILFASVSSHTNYTNPSRRGIRAATVNYPNAKNLTRITSMSALTSPLSEGEDLLVSETPEAYVPGKNDPYYPMTTKEAKALYEEYESLNTNPDLLFAGRMGSYQYLNLDQAVGQGIKLSESF